MNLFLLDSHEFANIKKQQFIYSLEKYERISRWNKVSTIKKRKEKGLQEITRVGRENNGKHNVKGDENTQNGVLLIKPSKLSTPKIFSMSLIRKIFTGLLLSLSLTFAALFKNHVEWIFPAIYSWWHLYARRWFSWYMLSDIRAYQNALVGVDLQIYFGDFSC